MNLKIALLAGDGIGPEVISEAVKVSNAIAEKFNHNIEWNSALTGAAAIDALGNPWTWGAGSFGRLGHGEDMDMPVPKKIDAMKGIICVDL